MVGLVGFGGEGYVLVPACVERLYSDVGVVAATNCGSRSVLLVFLLFSSLDVSYVRMPLVEEGWNEVERVLQASFLSWLDIRGLHPGWNDADVKTRFVELLRLLYPDQASLQCHRRRNAWNRVVWAWETYCWYGCWDVSLGLAATGGSSCHFCNWASAARYLCAECEVGSCGAQPSVRRDCEGWPRMNLCLGHFWLWIYYCRNGAEHPAMRMVLAARVGFTASVWSSAVPPDLKGVGIDGTLSRFPSLDSFAESQ